MSEVGGVHASVDEVGLCAECEHARVVESARGSEFYLCRLSDTDARFAKYPRLPVLDCEGFSRARNPAEQREDER